MPHKAPVVVFGLDHDSSRVVLWTACGCLITFAGIMSGLTLSLFSLDKSQLKVLKRTGTPTEQARASSVLHLLQNPHWLLVTLLLGNAAAVESMPMLFNRLMQPVAAVVVSTILVLIFGEILPQAIFVHHALLIGSVLDLPLRALMFLTAPISWTVGRLLDCLVGHRSAVFFRRREIRAFIQIQQEMGEQLKLKRAGSAATAEAAAAQHGKPDAEEDNRSDSSGGEDQELVEYYQESVSEEDNLSELELHTMLGALMLKEQTVEHCMKPMSFAVTLNETELLTAELVNKLVSTGLSRFPVWSTGKDHIKGYLMLKSLLYLVFMDPRDAPMVRDVRLFEPILQVKNEPLLELYRKFQNHASPLAIIIDPPGTTDKSGNASSPPVNTVSPVGFLTLEDVLEKIHNIKIEDEMDGSPAQLIIQDWENRRREKLELALQARSPWFKANNAKTPLLSSSFAGMRKNYLSTGTTPTIYRNVSSTAGDFDPLQQTWSAGAVGNLSLVRRPPQGHPTIDASRARRGTLTHDDEAVAVPVPELNSSFAGFRKTSSGERRSETGRTPELRRKASVASLRIKIGTTNPPQ